MPTYTYQCDDCGHSFDAFQKFSDDALTVCPSCEGTIRRVIQPTPIVFKGSGWYINDSKGKNASMSSGKEGEAKGGDAEAKPAAKAETPAASSDAAAETKPAATSADDGAAKAKPKAAPAAASS